MSGPTAAFLGPGAEALAWTALRSHRPRGERLHITLGPERTEGVRRPARRRTGADGRRAAVLAERSGVDVRPARHGLACRTHDPGAVLALLAEHDGPAALAVATIRTTEVDALLERLDELVLAEPPHAELARLATRELQLLGPPLTVVDPPQPLLRRLMGGESGQSSLMLLAAIAVAVAVAVGLATIAGVLDARGTAQGRADVASLVAARVLLDAQDDLWATDPAARITMAEFRARVVGAARVAARANDLDLRGVELLGDQTLPTRVRVSVRVPRARLGGQPAEVRSTAEVVIRAVDVTAAGGGYAGPLAERQGQRMRPDVAIAFDRLAAAARRDGHALVITSAFRSDAEQAALFARNPDPTWVAPPGKSLHRLGTELDLGPNSAWGWLAANAPRFGFKKRYSWEAWHFGFVQSAGTASVGFGGASSRERGSGSAVPTFVPARYAPLLARAAQRWSVGAALLGAQIHAESGFDPRAVSGAGAGGIAQFMPATAAAYGLTSAERFDPAKAIDAQAHLMHDLLRQFGSVPLALAAYNAGPAPVQRCGCVPPYPETQGYVQKILALLGGAGLAAPGGPAVRLVA